MSKIENEIQSLPFFCQLKIEWKEKEKRKKHTHTHQIHHFVNLFKFICAQMGERISIQWQKYVVCIKSIFKKKYGRSSHKRKKK